MNYSMFDWTGQPTLHERQIAAREAAEVQRCQALDRNLIEDVRELAESDWSGVLK